MSSVSTEANVFTWLSLDKWAWDGWPSKTSRSQTERSYPRAHPWLWLHGPCTSTTNTMRMHLCSNHSDSQICATKMVRKPNIISFLLVRNICHSGMVNMHGMTSSFSWFDGVVLTCVPQPWSILCQQWTQIHVGPYRGDVWRQIGRQQTPARSNTTWGSLYPQSICQGHVQKKG